MKLSLAEYELGKLRLWLQYTLRHLTTLVWLTFFSTGRFNVMILFVSICVSPLLSCPVLISLMLYIEYGCD